MNLLFAYIKESRNGFLKNQSFNFSKEYDITMLEDSQTIEIILRTNIFDYDSPIYNISAIVGRNGSGKSTLIKEFSNPKTMYVFENKKEFYIINQDSRTKITFNKVDQPFKDITNHVSDDLYTTLVYYSNNILNKTAYTTGRTSALFIVDHSNNSIFNNLLNETLLEVQTIADNRTLSHFKDITNLLNLSFISKHHKFINDYIKAELTENIHVEFVAQEHLHYFTDKGSYFSKKPKLLKDYSDNIYPNIKDVLEIETIIYQNTKKVMLFNFTTNLIQGYIIDIVKKIMTEYELGFEFKSKLALNFDDNFKKNILTITNHFIDALGNNINHPIIPELHSLESSYLEIESLVQSLETANVQIGNEVVKVNIKNDENFISFFAKLMDYDLLTYFRFIFVNEKNSIIQLSSGELELVSLLTRIDYLNNPLSDTLSCSQNGLSQLKKLEDENLIIVLDEPDSFLHPEWSRKFISILILFLEENFKQNIQVIFTTNSPFMLSDIPSQNVIYLENGQVRRKEIQTFGQNIHTLLKQGFFMDSTMGQFVKNKIEKINSELDLYITKKEKLTDVQHKEYKKIINVIGEPIIQNHLREKLKKVSSEQLRIIELQKEIDELRGKLHD